MLPHSNCCIPAALWAHNMGGLKLLQVNHPCARPLLLARVPVCVAGTHGATDLPNDAEEYVLPQFLEEHHLPVYQVRTLPCVHAMLS